MTPERWRAAVETCLTHWRCEPGLLIVKPNVAAIARLREDRREGDRVFLKLDIDEVLSAPAGFVLAEADLSFE